MGCEQGFFHSARSPFPAALLLLVVVLLIDPGLGDRSSEEKRNKKLAAEKAALASGKVSAQQSEDDTNTSTAKVEEPDQAAEDFLATMAQLTERQSQLKKEQRNLQEKLDTEKHEKSQVEIKLRNLKADLQSMRGNKQTCEKRIDTARRKLESMSTTYEILIARAEQAITCLRGLCKEAEQTFVYQMPMSNGGKENFEKLKQETNINAVNQDLTLSTTKASQNTQTQNSVDGSIKDNTGFFKDIKTATTPKSPTERESITDDRESITKAGNDFFNQKALQKHVQKAENTFEDTMFSTTEKSQTENAVRTDGGSFFKEDVLKKAQTSQTGGDSQSEGSEGTTTPQDSFFAPNAKKELQRLVLGGTTTTNKEAIQTQADQNYIKFTDHSEESFFRKDASNLIKKDLNKAKDATSGQTQKNFCEKGTLEGSWSHGSETENYGGKPEIIRGTKVVFADGHEEDYTCTFDDSKGTEITFSMTVGGNLVKFEGKVLNDGKLIAWNDDDYWHKENTAEVVKQGGSNFFNEGSIDQYKKKVNRAAS